MSVEQDVAPPQRLAGVTSAKPRSKTQSRTKTAATSGADKRQGIFIRLSTPEKERAAYWAEKRGYSSTAEYIAEAVSEQIRRENLDYDLPTLEIARLNELVDQVAALSRNQANIERVVTAGFESLLGLTRGDNYLLDAEDGDLDNAGVSPLGMVGEPR